MRKRKQKPLVFKLKRRRLHASLLRKKKSRKTWDVLRALPILTIE